MLNSKAITTILLLAANQLVSSQSFFVPTTYRGAFGSSDWTQNWTNWTPRNTSYPAGSTVVQGEITSNTTWTSNKTYLIKGYVYVKNNAVLTIEPGTIIRCDVLSTATLIITRGAKLVARGTESQPIVFTSSEAAGSRTYGDWGGLVILGNGKINAAGGTADVGAGINNSNGDGLYGGTDDHDSSGSLRYVRIEFAGIQYQPDKEIPGLALAGVGARTEFDFLQISYCGNDGLHLAGGASRIKHLVIHRGYDSDISMDLGYRGLLQFCVILRDSAKANASGTSGIDVQNDGIASSAQPYTNATISNFTILGPITQPGTPYSSGYRNGIHLRRNGSCAVFNSAIAGYPRGLMLDGQGSAQHLQADDIVIQSVILAGNKVKQADTTGNVTAVLGAFNFNTWLSKAAYNNTLTSLPKDLKLTDPYNYNSPVFVPKSGSSLLSGAVFTHARLNDTELHTRLIEFTGYTLYSDNGRLTLEVPPAFPEQNLILTIMDPLGRTLARETTSAGNHQIQCPQVTSPVILLVGTQDGTLLLVKKIMP